MALIYVAQIHRHIFYHLNYFEFSTLIGTAGGSPTELALNPDWVEIELLFDMDTSIILSFFVWSIFADCEIFVQSTCTLYLPKYVNKNEDRNMELCSLVYTYLLQLWSILRVLI